MAMPHVTLGISAIKSLLNNRQALEEFPFLRAVPAIKTSSCRTCDGQPVDASEPDYNWVKLQVLGLPEPRRKRLRQLLNAVRVSVSYYDGQKRRQTAAL